MSNRGVNKRNLDWVRIFTVSLGMICFSQSVPAQAELRTYGILGDAGKMNSQIDDARKSLARDSIFKLIMPGDNLYDTRKHTYPMVWDVWKRDGFIFDIVALGNHSRGYAEEMAYFQMPSENYTRVEGGVRFVVVNSDNKIHGAAQVEWADQILEQAQEKLVFLVYHHPTYTISDSHTWTERKDFQVKMRALLAKYRKKVTAVLIGHDHISSILDFGGTPAIVAGAVGEQFPGKWLDYVAEDGARIKTGWLYSKEPSWVRMDTDSDSGTVWINFVKSTDQRVLCSVRIAPGAPLYRDNCRR